MVKKSNIEYRKELGIDAFEANPGYTFTGPRVYDLMKTGDYTAEIILKKKTVTNL